MVEEEVDLPAEKAFESQLSVSDTFRTAPS